MLAPTCFCADYGCHVRIREAAEVIEQLWFVLVRNSSCWCSRPNDRWPYLSSHRSLPVSGNKRWVCGRLYAQSIQVADLARWGSGHLVGALAGMPIMTFALRPSLGGVEVWSIAQTSAARSKRGSER